MVFVAQALARLHAGKLGEAEQICRDVIDDSEQRPDALHILGLVAHRRGNQTEALAFMKDAVNADPRNGDRRLELGLLAYEIGSDYDAVAHLEALLAGCGEVPQALNCLGNALLRLGHPNAAIDRLERSVSAAPRWAKAWTDLAKAYRSAKRPMAAARALEGAYRQAPNTETLLALGETLMEAGNLARANAYFKHLVKQDPSHVRGWLQYGNALRDLGHTRRALEAHREAARMAPDDALAQVELAQTQMLLGKLDDAFKQLTWRPKLPGLEPPGTLWDGKTPPHSGELTAYADGEPGHTIALCRLVPSLSEWAEHVRLAVQPALAPLLRDAWLDADEVEVCSLAEVKRDATVVDILSLPAILGQAGGQIQLAGHLEPWLRLPRSARSAPAPSDEVVLRVGVNVSPDSTMNQADRNAAARLLDMPNGAVACMLVHPDDAQGEELIALGEQIAQCDLVITNHLLTTHMAGALGVPAWALVPHGQGPMLGENGNGLYPGVRVYRSCSPSGWRAVFDAVHAALEEETQVTECEVAAG